jgi:NADH:ubiquinone oxidoreductase subunit D
MEKNSYLRLGGLQNKSGEKLISKVRRTTKNIEKNSYLRLGGLQNKSGEKLISKVWRTTKNMEKKTHISNWEDYKIKVEKN